MMTHGRLSGMPPGGSRPRPRLMPGGVDAVVRRQDTEAGQHVRRSSEVSTERPQAFPLRSAGCSRCLQGDQCATTESNGVGRGRTIRGDREAAPRVPAGSVLRHRHGSSRAARARLQVQNARGMGTATTGSRADQKRRANRPHLLRSSAPRARRRSSGPRADNRLRRVLRVLSCASPRPSRKGRPRSLLPPRGATARQVA